MVFQLTLMITGNCNISCRHCLFGANNWMDPHRDMPLEDAFHYIGMAAEIAHSHGQELAVSFSGGEPFLRFSELLELTGWARQKGASRVAVMSNGFWGQDRLRAHSMVDQLRTAGLNGMGFSVDDFHQEFVPLETVLSAVGACRQAGMPFAVKSAVTRKTRRLPQILGDLEDLLLNQSVQVEEIACAPEGRGATMISPDELLCEEGIPRQPCPAGLMLTILPDGSTYPCCGTGWSNPLLLGNARKDDMYRMFEQQKRGPLMTILRTKSPVFLYNCFQQAGASFSDRRYVSVCDLCQEVLEHPSFETLFEAAALQWRKDRVGQVMAGVLDQQP